jgi:ribosomal protein S1
MQRSSSRPSQPPRTVRGTIAGFSGDDVIVELGPRMQGVIALREFETRPELGAALEFTLGGQQDGLWTLSLHAQRAQASWDEVEPGAIVKAKVTGQNTGGLELKLGPLAAFMPLSLLGSGREEDPARFIGQTLECEVLEVDAGRKRLLLSRVAVLAKQREHDVRERVGSLATGQVVRGKVTRVESFGAFVELGGGLEGLLHVSNISHRRVESAKDALAPGQEVQVAILEIKDGGKRISLSAKQLEPDPWQTVGERYAPERVVRAKVVRLVDFGAFLELEPGIEGLLHISQLGGSQRVRRVKDALALGQELDVRVVSVDPHQKRVSLSRLDSRGSLLGSEDAAEASAIDAVIAESSGRAGARTNLGALFRQAFDKDARR